MILGSSLSLKQCQNFQLNHLAVLKAAIQELGIKRFRCMSYWDEIETSQGVFDYSHLDQQISYIAKHQGEVTLCLGVRQPRWPESHWPKWSQTLSTPARNEALLQFIARTVNRYKHSPAVVSWQLENEALLKNFGENGDFARARLRKEFALVKRLNPNRPIVMTTSTSWGIPFRQPIPDIAGFSYYRITHTNGKYRKSIYQPWIFKLRAFLIKLLWRRPSFIHELQAEPWGPKAIWEMSATQQTQSMNPEILRQNITAAKQIGLENVDLWGLEWWYWLKKKGDSRMWDIIKKAIRLQ